MPGSRRKINFRFREPDAPAKRAKVVDLLDDDDFDQKTAPASKAANEDDYSGSSSDYSDSSYSSDDDHAAGPEPPNPNTTGLSSLDGVAGIQLSHDSPVSRNQLRLDSRLIGVMDSSQILPEVRDTLINEQKQFGSHMSQRDRDFAKSYFANRGTPMSGAPVDDARPESSSRTPDAKGSGQGHGPKDDYDDEEDDKSDDDDYDGPRHRDHDDRRHHSSSSRDEEKRKAQEDQKRLEELRRRQELRIEYRLLQKQGIVSSKQYNIMTTPIEYLIDDLSDLRIDSRIDQWTTVVKDIIIWTACGIEYANYWYLNERFSLDGYGKFMETRIPHLRVKIVRVAALMVKNGATIHPIFDLVLAMAGQTMYYVTVNRMTQNMAGFMPPMGGGGGGGYAPGPTPRQQEPQSSRPFQNMNRQVPDLNEYQPDAGQRSMYEKAPPPMTRKPATEEEQRRMSRQVFRDEPTYNGNVRPRPDDPPASTSYQQQYQQPQRQEPQNPFNMMMGGGGNNVLMNMFNALTGGMAPTGLGQDFQQNINSMLPNNGNFDNFEDVMKHAENDMRQHNGGGGGGTQNGNMVSEQGNIKPDSIVLLDDDKPVKKRRSKRRNVQMLE